MPRKLRLALVAPIAFLLVTHSSGASASDTVDNLKKHHALSLIGSRRMGHFKHFAWVNPDATKGGRVRQWALGSFDSLNPFPVKGNAATYVGVIYDTLLSSSPDEPSTAYALVAEWVAYPDDFSSATFQLRDGARFHDGKPVTPEDVIFSLDALKKASPQYAFYYKNVTGAEKVGERQVRFSFNLKGNRELPLIVGGLPIAQALLGEHWSQR
jgi:microcin C transport system substrate-binding protein